MTNSPVLATPIRTMTAADVIALLGLEPHVQEGGYFRETYRSKQNFGASSLSTAIYYLLTPTTRSHMHRLRGDEVYHFYLGDPVEHLQLWPDGSGRVETLGPELSSGQIVQLVVPSGVWQGSRLKSGGQWALLGTTMAPGFSVEGFELGDRAVLIEGWTAFATMIQDLTRN
jgi:uncharacterized protein